MVKYREKAIFYLKKPFVTNSFFFGIGHVGFLVARLMRDIFLAHTMGSHLFGSWAAFNILRQYGGYTDLGLFNGLTREIPRVRDNKTLLQEYVNIAAFGTFLATLGLIVWFILFEMESYVSPDTTRVSILLMLAFIAFEKIYKYFNSLFVGFADLKKAGIFLLILSAADLGLAIFGAVYGGLQGILVGTVAAIVLTSMVMYRFRPISVGWEFSRPSFKSLASSSLLLMCFGLLNVALKNLDRTSFIFLKGDDVILGSHHAASLVAMSVSILPFIFVSVINPRIYAFRQEQNEEILDVIKKYGSVCCVIGCLLAIVVHFLGPWIGAVFFPKQEFISVILPYLLGVEVFIAASLVLDAVIVVKNRGSMILGYKALVLGLFMAGRVLYFYTQGIESSLVLATDLSKSLMCVHMLCFLGSLSYVLFLCRGHLGSKTLKILGVWPILLTLTVIILLN
ncbi:MAG TPA: hypothetical protein VGE24_14425 [Emticicia sp.]